MFSRRALANATQKSLRLHIPGPDQTAIHEDYREPVELPRPANVTVESVRDEWMKICADQGAIIETLTTCLEESNAAVEAARHLMKVFGQLGANKQPLFVVNGKEPQAADLIRHAILDLNAKLQGSEIPALALQGRSLQ